MGNLIKFLGIGVVAGLTACATPAQIGRAMSYNSKVHQIETEDGMFRVFEHDGEDSLMTTPALGLVFGNSMVKGATLSLVDIRTPEKQHEMAARQHLDQTGREQCEIISGYLLFEPQYEFRFVCEVEPV